MNPFPYVRFFHLSPSGIACDEEGLRVGGIPLLARNSMGGWGLRDERHLCRDLSRAYGLPIDVRAKRAGLATVANALNDRNLAKAQISALLLQLPDPPFLADGAFVKSEPGRLIHDLVARGLLKADDDWDEEHPRTGTAPNPGWFAPKPKDPAAAKPAEGAVASGAAALAADAGGFLDAKIPAIALGGLETLAARISVPTILFDAIFVPSSNAIVDEGPLAGRPDMTYRWARDESTVTFRVLIDGQWRTLTLGTLGQDNLFRDPDGDVVARVARAPGQRPTLVTTVDALDRAEAKLLRQDGQPVADTTDDTRTPKLCPDPTPEPKTTKSKNSIAYQEYVSGLPYGLAINVGGLNFDGCDLNTGNLLEAKANLDFIFDSNDVLKGWVYYEKNPRIQMERQANVALADGRIVVWHAQTPQGFRGLSKIAEKLGKRNLFVVYDPNMSGGP